MLSNYLLPLRQFVIVTVLLTVFFKTSLGLSIRATGDNADMVRASSINVDAVKMIALAISNACIAFCGGLIAQYQSFADINSGVGILVVGLASVIIGEAFFWPQKSDDRVYFSHCGFHCVPLYYCPGNKIRYVPGVHAEIDFGNYCNRCVGCSGYQDQNGE